MTLRECMEQHTDRDLEMWEAWFDLEMGRPGRTEWYLMRVCEMVLVAQGARDVDINKFKVHFKDQSRRGPPLTIEQADMLAKARWFPAVGIPMEVLAAEMRDKQKAKQ